MKKQSLPKALAILFAMLIIFGGNIFAAEKIPITTESDQAKEYFIKARELAEKLRAQESLQYYTKAIEEDPGFAVAYLNRAFNQTSAKAFFKDLNKAVALSNNVSEGERFQILAAEAGVNGNPKQQKKYLEKLVGMYPDDERAHNLYGQYFFGQQEDEKAIEAYKKAIAINPEFSQPYNQMGYAYRNLEKYDEAEKAFLKYIELIPDDPNPYDSYAELQLKIGNYDKSMIYYKKALAKDPDFAASRYGLAANYIYLENYNEARRVLEMMHDVAKTDGQKRTALFGIACSYIDEGEMKEALRAIKKQYKIAESNKDYAQMSGDLFNIATINYEMGNYNTAMDKFKESVAMFEKSAADKSLKENAKMGLLVNEANHAMRQKDFKTAEYKSEQFMERAKEKENPAQIRQAHQMQAILALEQNDAAECLSHLKKANQQNPYNLYRMAEAYKVKGDKKKAKEYYTAAKFFNALPNINSSLARYRANKALATL